MMLELDIILQGLQDKIAELTAEVEFQKSEVSRLQLANKLIVQKTQKNLDEMRARLAAK